MAANQVRKTAELQHDFEFQRKLLTLSVNGITGGSLLNAVISGTATTVDIKSIINLGLFDTDSNLRPARWSTVAEGLRNEVSRTPIPRYPSDAGSISPWSGQLAQFTLTGDTVYAWPKTTAGHIETYTLGIEAYVFDSDWTGTNDVTVSSPIPGTFAHIGTYDSYGLYWREVGSGFLYRTSVTDAWILNGNYLQSDPDPPYWKLETTSQSPVGTYTAVGTTGSPVVTDSIASYTNVWTKQGQQYLQWGTICQLNHLYKEFVFRQEGNLPPPEKYRDEGLATLINWDVFRYEQFRQHG